MVAEILNFVISIQVEILAPVEIWVLGIGILYSILVQVVPAPVNYPLV